MPATGDSDGSKVVVRNKKARHDYHILETWEAGLALQGTEVKSLRGGRANLQDAFARPERGELWLHNLHISPYDPGNRYNHDPLRPRKLLLHKREIRKMIAEVERQGLTLVPLDIYFKRGMAKITLALARGKQQHDRRDDLKRRDAEREMERALKR
jgi:SsrA-binding protein